MPLVIGASRAISDRHEKHILKKEEKKKKETESKTRLQMIQKTVLMHRKDIEEEFVYKD